MKGRLLTAVFIVMLMASMACAQVRFDSVSMEPTYIEPGDDVEFYVKFHEGLSKREILVTPTKDSERLPVGDEAMKYYKALIVPKDDATDKYVIIKERQRNVGHMFPGETWTTPFEIHVSDKAPATTYTLTFEVLKTNIDGTEEGEVILSRDLSFNVQGTPKISIDSDSQLKAGEITDFNVKLTNVGGGTARHVTVGLNATSPLSILKSASVYVGDMSGKTSREVTYQMHVDSSADPKAYNVPVLITYVDRNGATQMVGQLIGVKIASMPMVSASLDSQDDFMAGTEGAVTVSVVNEGFVDAKFLSVELVETNEYTVTSNSDVYIGNLASDDFETEDFEIKVADGVSGKIPLKVKVKYTEENNNERHIEEPKIELNVLSAGEYYKKHPKANGTQQLMSVVMVIPALVIGYIVLWLLFKIVGAITGFIDRKVFRRP